jgi:phosphoenolpyruvate-protein kinase (PTS system EI component)
MQTARELTPQEVEEGRRGITTEQLTATQVQALVKKMDQSKQKWRKLKKEAYEEKLKEENSILYFNYPSLFQLHLENKLDSTFFEMLNLKRKIEKGEISAEQASQIVGQTLFTKFVPQSLRPANTTPAMSYEDYYRQNSS